MSTHEQRFIVLPSKTHALQDACDGFLIAQEAARHSPLTLKWYTRRLERFLTFLHGRGITAPEHITTTECRTFIVELQRGGLAENSVHGYAQALKTFCRFLESEGYAPTNAMARVQMPKLPKTILPAFTPEDVKKLLGACLTTRDTAIVYGLLDSGARGAEFCALRVQDVDMKTGEVRILHGKGAKDRTCYLGSKARLALLKSLRERPDVKPDSPLWATETGSGLTYWGLMQLCKRLGKRAGVEHCHPHTFRRTCALWSLRAGMSVYHLQSIMGHEDLQTLRRYLELVESDSQDAHKRHGAVDNML